MRKLTRREMAGRRGGFCTYFVDTPAGTVPLPPEVTRAALEPTPIEQICFQPPGIGG